MPYTSPSLFIFNRKNNKSLLIYDEEMFFYNLRNILLTNTKERLYNFNFGAGLYGLVFELFSTISLPLLRQKIEELIKEYEPRIQLDYVQINSDESQHIIKLQIAYSYSYETKNNLYVKEITLQF